MRDYVLVTDSDTEIPYDFAKEYEIPVFLMPFAVDGEEQLYDLGHKCDENAFFSALRAGATARTSTRPPTDIVDFFEEQLRKDKDILYLCFSSQLSGHYSLAQMAREEALSKFPGSRIEIVDTLKISMGAGLIVMQAARLWKNGSSLDEVAEWVVKNRARSNAWFMADDLSYLKRGGRLSGSAAFVGTLLDVKPMLVLAKNGKVVNVDKIKGKKKAIAYLVDKMAANIENPEEQTVYVLHGGVPEDALSLADAVKAAVKAGKVEIKLVGPVIGAHCGPNVLAVIFMGKETP